MLLSKNTLTTRHGATRVLTATRRTRLPCSGMRRKNRSTYSGAILRRLNSAVTESWIDRASDDARAASESVGSGQSPGYLVSTAHSVNSARSGWASRRGQSPGRRLRKASRSWVKGKSTLSRIKAAFSAFSAACWESQQECRGAVGVPAISLSETMRSSFENFSHRIASCTRASGALIHNCPFTEGGMENRACNLS